MKLARFVFCQERQIEIDGPSQCRVQGIPQYRFVHAEAVLQPEVMANPRQVAYLGFLFGSGNIHCCPRQGKVGGYGQCGGIFPVGFGNVVYQIVQIVSYRVHQRHAQFQPVGWVYGPVAQLHIQVPPGIGPGSQHLPGTAVVEQSAAGAGGRCQLVHLSPVEILHLLVGKAHETLWIVVMPPFPVCFPEHGQVGFLQACQCRFRLLQSLCSGKGMCVAYDKCACILFPNLFPGCGSTAAGKQGLPAEVQPIACGQLRGGIGHIVFFEVVLVTLPDCIQLPRRIRVFRIEFPGELLFACRSFGFDQDIGTLGSDTGSQLYRSPGGTDTPDGFSVP